MISKHQLGLLGSIILTIGVFMPIVSFPIVGSINYIYNGRGDGVLVLMLAVISIILVSLKIYKGLWFTGIGSLWVMLYTFINLQSGISKMKKDLNSDLADNPFRGLADIAVNSVQIQWGWAVLVVGSGLMIACAASKNKRQQEC
jgi:hypothetical protein